MGSSSSQECLENCSTEIIIGSAELITGENIKGSDIDPDSDGNHEVLVISERARCCLMICYCLNFHPSTCINSKCCEYSCIQRDEEHLLKIADEVEQKYGDILTFQKFNDYRKKLREKRT
jgi:hypothetical protein